MVVVPAVAGALGGRWLDERFKTGIFWTLSLLVFGAMIGSASAWRHVRKELDA
jgi:ATP synthase protein I